MSTIKITKIDAFSAITEAMDSNDIFSANEMLKIVSNSIFNDKKNRHYSSYIELKKQKDIHLFQKFVPTGSQKEIKKQEESFIQLSQFDDLEKKKPKEELNSNIKESIKLENSNSKLTTTKNCNVVIVNHKSFLANSFIYGLFVMSLISFSIFIFKNTFTSHVDIEDNIIYSESEIELGYFDEYNKDNYTVDSENLEVFSDIIKVTPTSTNDEENPNYYSLHVSNEDLVITSSKLLPLNELSGNTILIPNKENNREIYFLGQYNESGRWDGNCITNEYEDNMLESILEANYNDGNMISYKKIVKDANKSNQYFWNIAKRTCEDDYNSGEILKYIYLKDYYKDFDINTVDIKDIMFFDEFENYIIANCSLEEYYNGNTSDGFYNDDTGNSYLIKFFEDGTVKMLYYGNFANGYPDDETGNAWYIVKNENTNYMYYKGYFKNGRTANNSGYYFQNNLSIERINEILEENNFNKILQENDFDIELNWDDTLKDTN